MRHARSPFDIVDSIRESEDQIELAQNALCGQLCDLACALRDAGLIQVDGEAFVREIVFSDEDEVVEARLTLQRVI
jgi:hypothetical protein